MSLLMKSDNLRNPPKAIEFLVGDRGTRMYSYTWKVHADRTSFYITQKDGKLMSHKFSLHGEDDRHKSGPVMMFRDSNSAPETEVPFEASPGFFPCKFTGVERFKDVLHVLRFRFPWDMFDRDHCPSAVPPAKLKSGRKGGLIALPRFMHAVDVDFYLSRNGRPVIPLAKDAIKNNAVIGPLRNDNGEYLIGQVGHHSILKPEHRTPESTMDAPPPGTTDDVSRGISIMNDGEIAWVVEQKLSFKHRRIGD